MHPNTPGMRTGHCGGEMKTPDKLAEPRSASGYAVNHADLNQSLNGDSLSDRAISNPGLSESEKVLSLIVQRIMELPPVTKKVLAMYYYENTQLCDIAACVNLPESKVCEMHRETLALLRGYVLTALA
jgi:DNA-directed RNA polymerase specialized sigma subunit